MRSSKDDKDNKDKRSYSLFLNDEKTYVNLKSINDNLDILTAKNSNSKPDTLLKVNFFPGPPKYLN